MKIRIVKAGEPTYWYSDKIGEVFDVVDYINKTDYMVVDPDDGDLSEVDIQDAEEVIEHDGQLYRKVDRPVRKGDTVLITKFDYNDVNEIRTVLELYYYSGKCDGSFDLAEGIGGEMFLDANYDEYNVIEAIHNALAESESNTSIEFNSDRLLDKLSNLAQEVAELKRNQEELIARINDLGDGAKATAVVPVEVIEKVIAELKTRKSTAEKLCDVYERRGQLELAQFSDGKSHANMEAIELLEEALRNG